MHHGYIIDAEAEKEMVATLAGVSRPERPQGAKDEVKRPKGPPPRSRGPEGPLDFQSLHISKSKTDLIFFSQATQLVELDREVATGLRKLEEELAGEGEEESKDLSQKSKAEVIDTGGTDTNQETKKENPND